MKEPKWLTKEIKDEFNYEIIEEGNWTITRLTRKTAEPKDESS